MSGRLRVALVPIGFATGALLCRVRLTHSPAAYAVDLAQPLIVVTYWQHFGLLIFLALLFAIATASVGYVAALRASHALSLPAIIAASALACAAALAFPVVFSSDAYAYAGYGFMALHGLNPYAHMAVMMRDPLMDAVLWQWGNPPPACVYGPAFVWLAQAVVALFGGLGPAATLWAFRISACVALVLCAPLANAALAPFPPRIRAAASAGIALNPVAIWSAAEGHNDPILIAIVLSAFALIARSRPLAGALVAALSVLVKAPGLLAAAAVPVIVSAGARSRALTGLFLGLGMAAIAGWPAMLQLSRNPARGNYFPQFSVQYAVHAVFGASVTIALTAVLVAALVIGARILLKHGNRDGAALLALALWIAIPNPYPWYGLWILPVAFLLWESPAGWAIVALTLAMVVRYLPDATTDLSTAASLAVAFFPPAVAAAVFIARSKRLRWTLLENRRKVPGTAPSRSL